MRADIEGKATKQNNATREAAIVTQADIARMRAAAVVISEKDAAQRKRINEEQKAQQQAQAKARKSRMQAMDKTRATKLPATEIELEQNERAEGLLAHAQQQLDEEHDDVKHMN